MEKTMDEKMIREIARTICGNYAENGLCFIDGDICDTEVCKYYKGAKALFDEGYCKQKQGRWVYSNMGCVINCSNCGERLELCYPDGTEIRETSYCPFCGAKMVKPTEDKND